MKKPFTIPCHFHSDETEEFDRIDVDYSSDSFQVKDIIFFNIDAMYEKEDGDTPVTAIFSGGQIFQSPLTIPQILKIITQC